LVSGIPMEAGFNGRKDVSFLAAALPFRFQVQTQ
jgi:hypothetical protein